MINERVINARYDGMIEGITLYAHWKDGVQYVGTTATPRNGAGLKSIPGASRLMKPNLPKIVPNINVYR